MTGYFVEYRYRPSPASHDRPLLVFAPSLEAAEQRALARLGPGQKLVPDRHRTFSDPQSCDNHYVSGIQGTLPKEELLEFLRLYALELGNEPRTRFDRRMFHLLDQLVAQQRREAAEDPNSDAARAVHEARQRDAELEQARQERRAANLQREREHNRERFAAKERERAIARKQAEILVDQRRAG